MHCKVRIQLYGTLNARILLKTILIRPKFMMLIFMLYIYDVAAMVRSVGLHVDWCGLAVALCTVRRSLH